MFQGEENTLTMNQTYSKEFQCLYLLHRYPFDTQVIFSFHQDCTLNALIRSVGLT